MASLSDKIMIRFFSLNFFNNIFRQVEAYVSNFFFNPLANNSMHLAASLTVITFKSCSIIYKKNCNKKLVYLNK